jgi:NAD(P)-dependent dehydrogenase (short-subunit alcohol dehydrogenase family)
VNAIAPGPVLTEQTALAPADKLAMVAAQIPAGRIGRAEEVGSLAVWLTSDDAGFVTGATVDINGGLLMR